MVPFFNEYRDDVPIGQLPVAELKNDSILPLSKSKLKADTITQLPVAKVRSRYNWATILFSYPQLARSPNYLQQLIAKIKY
jgi:hypothetical protein